MDKVVINLANPRGFCAGVDIANVIVNRELEVYCRHVYVKQEVVHNRFVGHICSTTWVTRSHALT